jgi:hypothetical protein
MPSAGRAREGAAVGAKAESPAGTAPPLTALLPWSVPAPRPGRSWVLAPEPETLRARWRRLSSAPPEERAALFRPSRSRTVDSAVPQLPGQATPTARLSRDPGPCPEPVRVRHGAFDRQWLLADQRLLDDARPELWRVADDAQVFCTVQPPLPEPEGPAVVFSAELPDGHRAKGRGRVLPLYRRPGGAEPNLAPGLTDCLAERLARPVAAEDVLAWIAAMTAFPGAARDGEQVPVPLTADPACWSEGVALGRRVLWLHTFGLRCADPAADRPPGRPRMPGGRRPFVRQALDGTPDSLRHDPETGALLLGAGRIAPVPEAAWAQHAGGSRVLTDWFAPRGPAPEGTEGLDALRASGWPPERTTELIDLVTVLALLAEIHPAQEKLRATAEAGPQVTAAELRAARVLPAPPAASRPASVLTHLEEGPEGQFTLL